MHTDTETLVTFSRRGLWCALVLLLALGGYALFINLAPDAAATATASRMMALLPIVIVIAVAALRSAAKGVSTSAKSGPMKSMLGDELRQQSLRLAYRNGLMTVLLAQPVLVMLLAWSDVQQPAVLMAGATALVGVATVLGSLLVYDR